MMKCKLVDVFAKKKFSGNGLTIFYDCEALSQQEMLTLTQEMRQFESIFIADSVDESSVRARIFTVEEELDFAGHPIIGLATHLHEESGDLNPRVWHIQLNKKRVVVKTKKTDKYFQASMDQGKPEFIATLNSEQVSKVLSALSLKPGNISSYPIEVISTGLPYLIVPIVSGIDKAKIAVPDFETLLKSFGAKFVYVFDVINFEGRTWDNDGAVEDIATGSAAGPVAAYIYKHKLQSLEQASGPVSGVFSGLTITISQGRFLGRPSEIAAEIEIEGNDISNIWVSGEVIKVADISFI